MWSGLRSTFQEFIQLLSQTEPFAWMGHVGTKKMCHHFGSFWNKRLANHTIQTCSLPSGVLDMTRCLWHGSSRERGLEGPGSHKFAQTREWQSNWINWHSNQPEYDRIFMRLQRILIVHDLDHGSLKVAATCTQLSILVQAFGLHLASPRSHDDTWCWVAEGSLIGAMQTVLMRCDFNN